MFRTLILTGLYRLGVIAFRQSSRIFLPGEDAYRVVVRLVGRSDPVIIDGGAHRGGAVTELSRLLLDAVLHCFEPDPVFGTELADRFVNEARVHVRRAALGRNCGKARFNINSSRPTNSLLPPSQLLQPDLKKLFELVEQVEVDVTTITIITAIWRYPVWISSSLICRATITRR